MKSHLPFPIPFLLLLLTALCTSATVPPPIFSIEYDVNITINSINDDDGCGRSNPYTRRLSTGTKIIAATLTLIIGFAFFGLYTTFCRRSSISDVEPTLPVSTSSQQIKTGLDPAAIDAFPTLTYSAATALKIGKETLECAICLCDFTEEEFLRMLPNCCHVFHPKCVGSWLEHHATCPVCRDNLAVGAMDKSERWWRREQWSMDFDLDLDPRRMGRSHSVDEVVRKGRHRLVLPEHVMKELVEKGRLRRWEEVAVLAGGEGSGRRGFRGLSDRWTAVILSRVFSNGDGSVRKGDKNSDCDSNVKDVEEGSCSDSNGSAVKGE